MHQKKKMPQTGCFEEDYLAPKVSVAEVRALGIICVSGGRDPENTYGGYSDSEQEGY